MYRFLFTPRWIGLGLVMAVAAAAMVSLGLWQLDRYRHRTEINGLIDAAAEAPARPLADVLSGPPGSATSGSASADVRWTRVTATGHYDPRHEILARARTVNGQVGFEVFTPLVLSDGSMVLVDRGWIPPAPGGVAVAPPVPPAPAGEVTVVGRVHAPESRANAGEPFGGIRSVRRVDPRVLDLPYPFVYAEYVTLENQTPPADPAFVAITPDHENSWMNAGYVVQWWAFAALALFGYGYLAVREKHTRSAPQSSAQSPTVDELVG